MSACDTLPTAARDAARGTGISAPSEVPSAYITVTSGTVARVLVSLVSGDYSRTTSSIPVGGTATFSAVPLDSAGRAISGLTARYYSSNAAVLAVDSVSGVVTALKDGSGISVIAVVNGVTGRTGNFSVAGTLATPAPEPTPTPVVPATPSAGAIAMKVVRFDGKVGAATVSNGVPLKAGALLPGQEGNVRVYVGGVEQAAYVAGLHSRHPDGSLRAVLVQFQVASLGSTPLAGQIDIGSARPTAMTLAAPVAVPGAVISGVPLGLPQAAALPSDPTYLVTTDLAGATTTTAANSALAGVYAKYESDFVTNADKLWAAEGANWATANYYDRALIYYAFWARTGNATYWARAGQLAHDYRAKYLEPNNYGASPHNAQLEGLEKHYLLTGAEASRVAVVKTGYALWSAYLPSRYMTGAAGESRIAARVLHSQLLAWRLTPAGAPVIGGAAGSVNWAAAVETAVSKIVAWQASNGSYPAAAVCGGQLNYMVGLLNEALIKTHDYYVPPTTSRATLQGTIKTLVTKAVTYLWTTQWRPTSRAFNYASVACSGVGSTNAAPDLNNMISPSFGWLYRVTGSATYLTNGDAVFAGGVTQATISLSKQFNENYTASFRFLGFR